MADDARIEKLLAEGLEYYGRGQEAEAVALWREALALDPGSPRARDYLDTAGVEYEPPPEPNAFTEQVTATQRVRREVLVHVRAGRYDQALHLLYADRRRRPNDPTLTKSIQHLKSRIMSESVEALGGLDGVPSPPAPEGLEPEQLAIARLVDGIASYEDILESSPLGRLRTLRVLSELFAQKPKAAELEPEPEPDPADPFDEHFKNATQAYIRRDYASARQHYERCLELRPGERRVLHNLERLKGKG